MAKFSEIQFADAEIQAIRVEVNRIEMDYRDWQEKTCTLEFINVVSCFMASPFNRPLSHCETEKNETYIADCCRIAGEDATSPFLIFDFIDAWEGQRIVRIVAESMTKR